MAGKLAGTTVLLADDDADNLELIEYIFSDAGATVRTASTGHDVLALLPDWKPDVMLLDISMPDMDGYELLGAIRQDVTLRDVPAIAVTGSAFQRDKQRAADAGFAMHVSKPFDGEALLHLVKDLTTVKPSNDSPERLAFLDALRAAGLHGALAHLNERSPHRFIGIYRFDGYTLRNVLLFDRMDPSTLKGDDLPLAESYCSIVGVQRKPFVTVDAMMDPRLTEHPARLKVLAYCGELLRNADGTPFGTLCSFDLVPQPTDDGLLDLLQLAAPIVAAEVASQI